MNGWHPPQIVFGLGSGRCGTQSLAALLNDQQGARVWHEVLGPAVAWEGGHRAVDEVLRRFLLHAEAKLVGDVASYYLPYVQQILAACPRVRFVCLKRDREETVASFLTKTARKNHWMTHDGTQWKRTPWDTCFPKYPASSKAEALGLYWDDYYRRAAELETSLPQGFRVFSIAELNTEEGQHAILEFLGIPRELRRLAVGLRLNASKPGGLRRLLDHVRKLAPWDLLDGKRLHPAATRRRGQRRAA